MKWMGSAIIFFVFVVNANAQIGKVGINTNTPAALLHVKDSSVVFTGDATLPTMPGAPPVIGAGTRMMWYPDKAAFRVGSLNGSGTDYWNKTNIGKYSIAMGLNTKASGDYSIAMGQGTTASHDYTTAMGGGTIANNFWATAMGNGTIANGQASTAMGISTTASGDFSTSMGSTTTASGSSSTAMGYGTTASGFTSVAMGITTIASGLCSFASGSLSKATGSLTTSIGIDNDAKCYAGTVVGLYNNITAVGSPTSIDPVNRLFQIGNGTASNARSNAMTVLQNGKIGVSTTNPQSMLHVVRNGTSGGSFDGNALAILESNTHSYIQFSQTNNTESGILSGNALTPYRSGMIFGADSTIVFRTGGNINRLRIANDGNVGIGTNTPSLLLHVAKNTSYVSGTSYGIAATNSTNPNLRLNLGYDGTIDAAVIQASQEGSTFNKTLLLNPNAGNVGIGSSSASAKLDVAGTTQTDGLQVSTSGTVFNRMEGGTTTLGTGLTGVNVYTITFPNAFSGSPKVIATVHAENFNDTFSVTTKNITSTSFQINIVRTDSTGGWAQNLQLDWFAFE